MLSRFLPSKRFLFVLLGLVVGGLFIYFGYQFSQERKIVEPITTSGDDTLSALDLNAQIDEATTIAIINNEDSDGDGLKNWEEGLWGTDPNNPDTDGDGVGDALQVRETQRQQMTENQGDSEENLTDIDYIVRDAYSVYAYLKQADSLTEDNQYLLEGEIINALYDANQHEMITSANLDLVFPNEENKLKYITDTGTIIQTYPFRGDYVLTSVQSSVEGAVTDEALGGVDYYESYARALEEVTVPTPWADEHVDLVNALRGLSNTLENLIFSNVDPLKGYSAVIRLDESIFLFQQALAAMAPIFEEYIPSQSGM